ncbi:long-chain fatty acid transport protein 2-like [Erpetoichthys calabaricus]|uniref:long-chain-fatty-acid--CoA ligase n=1 Tax=Erpetoichthys calabaricus TaxID=27687 RepID=A0A8C4TGH9_ERPCA|nr:long-chain fatty acid transport protein 2-like [Erpetoichthys calabaricus]
MYAICALLALLVFLPPLLRHSFPYFWQDANYLFQYLRCGVRISRYSKKKPFYSVLDGFLEHVKKQPEKPFIIFEDQVFSYQEADRHSNKVARALRNHAGLSPGDCVAVFLGNEPNFLWTWLALAKLGCIASLLNYNIRAKSLLHCFTCCGANVLLVAAELKSAVEEVLPTLREKNVSVYIFSDTSDNKDIQSLGDKINQASDEPLPQSLRDSINFHSKAAYIYTSGTTGLPKAAVITHHRLWAACFLQGMLGVKSNDIIYINLPLYHSAGLLMGVLGAIERGITIVLSRKFSTSQFWNDCQKHNVTIIQYVGEVLRYLCNTPKSDSDRHHRVRLAIGNGARMDTWKEFLHRFGDIQVCECYGATEGNVGFVNYTGRVGAIGREVFIHKKLFPYSLIKYDTEREEPVRNSRGFCKEVEKGETGLLVIKITKIAPFTGYAKNREQTEKKQIRDVFKKGDVYFNSGDLLKVDHDNFIYFQDRIGDTFRWKGENVATSEVESILILVDCIAEANVYGVLVPGHEGRTGMASVKLKEGKQFNAGDIFTTVAHHLPTYARPRFIRIQNSIEVTGTLKQLKVKLSKEGFNMDTIRNPLYFLDDKAKTYVPMTRSIYEAIISKQMRL